MTKISNNISRQPNLRKFSQWNCNQEFPKSREKKKDEHGNTQYLEFQIDMTGEPLGDYHSPDAKTTK